MNEKRGIEMTNLVHPGPGIREDLKEISLSIVAAARILRVPRQRLAKVLNGKKPVTADLAFDLEPIIGKPAETWLHIQVAYDLDQLRRKVPPMLVRTGKGIVQIPHGWGGATRRPRRRSA